jgi:acyl carrier protein
MEKLNEIFKNVCEIIEKSIGTPKESITLQDTLFEKLGVDSIDLVDILFELETKYNIELKVSDLEAKSKEELGDIPYEIDGVITPEGLASLKKHMTEIETVNLQEGITIHQLVQMFTVESLCKLVLYRLEMSEKS